MTSTSSTIPEGLDLIDRPDGFTIRKVWLTWKVAPLAIFAILWDAFLVFWYVQAFSKPNPPLMTILFPIGHVAAGVGITYFVIASLRNRTDVVISSAGVRVVIGPMPWVGNREVRADQITDVLVRERSTNRGGKSFAVMYADCFRKEKKLVTSLWERDQAEFIVGLIRQTLRLTSRAP